MMAHAGQRSNGMSPLWTADEIAAATGGTAHGDFEVSGVTFDSREVQPGDLFIAMPGTAHDGHSFIPSALEKGAAGLLVSQPASTPHVLVDDVAAALVALGKAARERVKARIIGVTGSVGKTSVKEALYAALDRWCRGKVHRSVKSYNNHTGVPLSLARMPRETELAVLEMGMSNAGEIAALTRMVRPHVALITAIGPAHIESLGSEEAIADAKGEIFQGLEPDGIAIIPNGTPYRDRLLRAARRHADRILTFGEGDADIRALHAVRAASGGSLIAATLNESEVTFTVSQRGDHWITNALAVLAAAEAVEADVAVASLALADLGGIKGRGERHRIRIGGGEALLIDESYNANPVSVAATLKSLGSEPVEGHKIAVLGSMKELGSHSAALHAGLAQPILDAGVDRLILVGEETRPLEEELTGQLVIERADGPDTAAELLLRSVHPGDAVLVKASNSVGLARLVERVAGGRASCST